MHSIQKTIHKNIHNYKKIFNKNAQLLNSKYIAYANKTNFIETLLLPEILNEVFELYNITEPKSITNSELLSKVLEIDNGKLLFIAFNKSKILVNKTKDNK